MSITATMPAPVARGRSACRARGRCPRPAARGSTARHVRAVVGHRGRAGPRARRGRPRWPGRCRPRVACITVDRQVGLDGGDARAGSGAGSQHVSSRRPRTRNSELGWRLPGRRVQRPHELAAEQVADGVDDVEPVEAGLVRTILSPVGRGGRRRHGHDERREHDPNEPLSPSSTPSVSASRPRLRPPRIHRPATRLAERSRRPRGCPSCGRAARTVKVPVGRPRPRAGGSRRRSGSSVNSPRWFVSVRSTCPVPLQRAAPRGLRAARRGVLVVHDLSHDRQPVRRRAGLDAQPDRRSVRPCRAAAAATGPAARTPAGSGCRKLSKTRRAAARRAREQPLGRRCSAKLPRAPGGAPHRAERRRPPDAATSSTALPEAGAPRAQGAQPRSRCRSQARPRSARLAAREVDPLLVGDSGPPPSDPWHSSRAIAASPVSAYAEALLKRRGGRPKDIGPAKKECEPRRPSAQTPCPSTRKAPSAPDADTFPDLEDRLPEGARRLRVEK